MTQISKGSKGSDVSTLQTLLNSKGYSLDVDGSFGSKTQAAVRDYQSKNGLQVDGIVGTNTWASLQGGNGNSPTSTATSSKTTTKTTKEILSGLEGNKPEYKPSDAVTQALNSWNVSEKKYTDMEADPFKSKYDPAIQGLIDKIASREPFKDFEFNYDYSKDPLYATYKDEYTNQANMAMRDTMGEAASLTGGYGSSYAQTVGQQAYQGQMSQLNDIALNLYDRAFDLAKTDYQFGYQKYIDEGNALRQNLEMYQGERGFEYEQHLDNLDRAYNDLQYFQSKYGTLSQEDYNKYLTNLDQWNKDRDYYYNKNLDEEAMALAAAGGGSGGGSGKSSGIDDAVFNAGTYQRAEQIINASNLSEADKAAYKAAAEDMFHPGRTQGVGDKGQGMAVDKTGQTYGKGLGTSTSTKNGWYNEGGYSVEYKNGKPTGKKIKNQNNGI